MSATTLLFHYGSFQKDWQQDGIVQAGPSIEYQTLEAIHSPPHISWLRLTLASLGTESDMVLLHYTDPFILRSRPLVGLHDWPGAKILACGDLHHGPAPLETLEAYLEHEPHDAVLLTFNPALLPEVRLRLSVPVRCLAPSFFRYPVANRSAQPKPILLHIGSVGNYHQHRRQLVETIQKRANIPFYHTTTGSPEESAALYAQSALVLNVPLNHDLNHRFFEIMAAGAPQIVYGDPGLVGENMELAHRPDVFWAKGIDELEQLASRLLRDPEALSSIVVDPPPYRSMNELLKLIFTA